MKKITKIPSIAACQPVVDPVRMQHAVQQAQTLRSIEEFKTWVRTCIRPLLPHEALLCVHGYIYSAGVSPSHLITVDFPLEHLQAIRNAAGYMDSPLVKKWYAQQAPVMFDAKHPPADTPQDWLNHFCKHDLRNAAANGMLDSVNCIATYFTFHRIPDFDNLKIGQILNDLTPLLHTTLARVVGDHQLVEKKITFDVLTEREQHIATLVSQGRSNLAIAGDLKISEHTIRNHLSRILGKTGCENRTHLAAALTAQQQNSETGPKVL